MNTRDYPKLTPGVLKTFKKVIRKSPVILLLWSICTTSGAKTPTLAIIAMQYADTYEYAGKENNKKILSWAKELDDWQSKYYTKDSIPWCGLFMAHVVQQAGLPIPQMALRARSWLTWGKPIGRPMVGDIIVLRRGIGGHVGIYVGEYRDQYLVLGGNQLNKVGVNAYSKSRLLGFRRSK